MWAVPPWRYIFFIKLKLIRDFLDQLKMVERFSHVYMYVFDCLGQNLLSCLTLFQHGPSISIINRLFSETDTRITFITFRRCFPAYFLLSNHQTENSNLESLRLCGPNMFLEMLSRFILDLEPPTDSRMCGWTPKLLLRLRSAEDGTVTTLDDTR